MIQQIEIKKLKLLDRNPRKITKEQMLKLEKSIEEDPSFLKCRPILVRDNDGVLEVYAGNQRVRAAKKLKWNTLPCIVDKASELTDEVVRKRIVKDNLQMGEFDFDILSSDYAPEELFEFGMTTHDLDLFKESLSESLPKVDHSDITETDEIKFITCPKCKHQFEE